MTLHGVFRKYKGRMRRLLYEARRVIREEGKKDKLAVSPIWTMDRTGEGEWSMNFTVHKRFTAAEKRTNAGMPPGPREYDQDDLDVSFTILDSEDSDGSMGGMAFSVDLVTIGGAMCGGMTPYNFTGDVWVPLKDAAAIEERFKLFEEPMGADGGVELGYAVVQAWQRHHG